MEVILFIGHYINNCLSFLHVCGGDPIEANRCYRKATFSPRMWRWSWTHGSLALSLKVFSTYVEVILDIYLFGGNGDGFLHVCGGDPRIEHLITHNELFSPRMWRWSWTHGSLALSLKVFSTYVEVIPNSLNSVLSRSGFLHVCGGDPEPTTAIINVPAFSPRMWRWSYERFILQRMKKVFSTYVEVILRLGFLMWLTLGFLHVCGGDPVYWTLH